MLLTTPSRHVMHIAVKKEGVFDACVRTSAVCVRLLHCDREKE